MSPWADEVVVAAASRPATVARSLLPLGRISAIRDATSGTQVAYRCRCDDIGIDKSDRKEPAR